MATIHRLQLNEVEAISRYRDIIEEELSQEVIDYGDEVVDLWRLPPGLRALHVVARAGEIDLARALIRKRANVNFCTTKGLSPLHYGVLSGKVSMVRLLLVYGARVNHQSQRDGKTPLLSAAEKGELEIVKLLLENGANPKISDHMGMLPSEAAAENGFAEVSALLSGQENHMTVLGVTMTSQPMFALMSHPGSQTTSPLSPLSSIRFSPSTFTLQITVPPVEQNSNMYAEPPPSYDEVMNSDSLFGCTAYSQSSDDSDTAALLGADTF